MQNVHLLFIIRFVSLSVPTLYFDAAKFSIKLFSYQVKSKSLLLSHHHSTCALMSEILESVLQTVQKQLTYRQYHYILTDLYRQCAIYTYSTYTQYTQCTVRHTYSYQYTLYTVCTHSTLCTHIYIHSNMQRCSRLYISWIRKRHVCALDGIQ